MTKKKLKWTHKAKIGDYLPIPKNELPQLLLENWSDFVWDVKTDNEGSGFICQRQEAAEILSMLLEINERLKRIERKMK